MNDQIEIHVPWFPYLITYSDEPRRPEHKKAPPTLSGERGQARAQAGGETAARFRTSGDQNHERGTLRRPSV